MPTQAAAPTLTLDIEHQGTTIVVHCHGRLVSGVTDVLYTGVRKSCRSRSG